MNTDAPTVFLVDDDAPFLTATERVLRANGFEVKAFDSPLAFLASISVETPGCVVLDLNMPGMSGLDLLTNLKQAEVGLPVIFLTGCGDIQTCVQAMRGGAEDFLEKRAPQAHLLDAIKRALRRDAEARPVRTQQIDLRLRFDSLSAREREVLGHLVQGRRNQQIGAAMHITERTVKAHRRAVKEKLGVSSTAELTRLTMEAGLFLPPAPPGA